jgi:hypothetical protein
MIAGCGAASEPQHAKRIASKVDNSVRTAPHTIVVNPVPGDAAASGAKLITAVAGITDASAKNPYVVKVEAGEYDVSGAHVRLPDFVDLEGSGEEATKIIGNNGAAIVLGQGEVRQLHVLLLPHVDFSSGIVCAGGTPSASIRKVTIEIPGNSFTAVWGISSTDTIMTIEDVTIIGSTVPVPPKTPTAGINGISVGTDSTLENVHIALTGQGDAFLTGVESFGGMLTVRDTDIYVEADGGSVQGVFYADASGKLDNVIVVAAGSRLSEGINCDEGTSPIVTIVDIEHSILSGGSAAIDCSNNWRVTETTVQVSASELDGPVIDTTNAMEAPVAFHCVDDYDGSLRSIDATCGVARKPPLSARAHGGAQGKR